MASPSDYPAQTLAVLAALYEQPTHWQDGPALALRSGVTPEQLHTIVSQLAAGGLAQIAQPGITRSAQFAEARYRLTADGLASAVMVLAKAAQPGRLTRSGRR